MHELFVTESILEIALRHGRAAGATAVTDLYLVVGELSSIVDDSVQFYWDIVSEGTPAAGSRLHFRRTPGLLGCRACGHAYSPRDDLPCPACGGIEIDVMAGEEFYLESIEVETTADHRPPTANHKTASQSSAVSRRRSSVASPRLPS
jgi:hydrogenase nickel incorporation protein HypA/HybF